MAAAAAIAVTIAAVILVTSAVTAVAEETYPNINICIVPLFIVFVLSGLGLLLTDYICLRFKSDLSLSDVVSSNLF